MTSKEEHGFFTFLEESIETEAKLVLENGKEIINKAYSGKVTRFDYSYMTHTLHNVAESVKLLSFEVPSILNKFRAALKEGKDFSPYTIYCVPQDIVQDINMAKFMNFTKSVEEQLGAVKSNGDITKMINSPYLNKPHALEKAICTTKFPEKMQEKDIALYVSNIPVKEYKMTNEWITSIGVPFMETIETGFAVNNKFQLASIEDVPFINICENISSLIKKAYKRFYVMLDVFVERCESNPAIDMHKVKVLTSMLVQLLHNLMSYIVSCTYVYVFTHIKNFNYFKQAIEPVISWNVTGAEDARDHMEDGGDEDYHVRNTTELVDAATALRNSILEFAKTVVSSSEIGYGLDDRGDMEAYQTPIVFIRSFSANFMTMIARIKVSALSTVEECNNQYHFDDSSFAHVGDQVCQRIVDMEYMKSVKFRTDFICGDLEMMIEKVPVTMEGFEKVIDFFGKTIKLIEANINDEFTVEFDRTDLINYIISIQNSIIDLRNRVMNAFYDRLKKLNEMSKTAGNVDKSREIVFERGNFFDDSLAKYVCQYQAESKEHVDDMLDAMVESARVLRLNSGLKSFLEGNDGNNTNTDQKNDQKPKVKTDGNNNEKKDSTKPSVQDNNNEENKSTNNNQSNTTTGTEKKKKISESLSELMQSIIDKVNEFFESGAKKKNLGFFARHKQYLLDRKYNNVSVTCLPYLKNKNYGKMIDQFVNSALNIDDNTLKTASEEDIINKVFASINIGSVKGDNLNDRILQAMKTGANKMETKTVSDGVLEQMVPNMIDYCVDYFENWVDKLTSSKGALDKLKPLDEKKNSGDNDRTEENVKVIDRCLTAAINELRIAAKDKANDYMLILSNLAKGDSN